MVYIPGGHSLTYGTLAVYICDEGFTLTGSLIRVCAASNSVFKGAWTSQPPLCSSEFIVSVCLRVILYVCCEVC